MICRSRDYNLCLCRKCYLTFPTNTETIINPTNTGSNKGSSDGNKNDNADNDDDEDKEEGDDGDNNTDDLDDDNHNVIVLS